MTTFPNSPRLLKAGIVPTNPDTSAIVSIIAVHHNFRSRTRATPQGVVTASEKTVSEVSWRRGTTIR